MIEPRYLLIGHHEHCNSKLVSIGSYAGEEVPELFRWLAARAHAAGVFFDEMPHTMLASGLNYLQEHLDSPQH